LELRLQYLLMLDIHLLVEAVVLKILLQLILDGLVLEVLVVADRVVTLLVLLGKLISLMVVMVSEEAVVEVVKTQVIKRVDQEDQEPLLLDIRLLQPKQELQKQLVV